MALQDEPNVVDVLIRQVGEYAETRTELLKLIAVERSSEVISSVAVYVAMYLFASGTILWFSVTAALFLGEWLGKYSYGFSIVSLAYVLAGIVVYLRRGKWLKDPVANLIITKSLGDPCKG